MANLKEIRSRIKSVKSTQQITKAMKMVSAAKLRRAQDNIITLRPYAGKLRELIDNLHNSGAEAEGLSPLTQVRTPEKILLVVVTSNKGLCGAFNANVNRSTWQLIGEKYSEQQKAGNVTLLCIGKYGFEFFSKRKYTVLDNKNTDLFSQLSFDSVNVVAERVIDGFVSGQWDRVEIIFNEFKNVATQRRVNEVLLPIQISGNSMVSAGANADYIFEPDREEILSELLPKSIKIQFFKAILESNAAEHGARMTAMDKATENANELLNKLKLYYNTARQAAITKELLEIVGGANALESN
jgi:F-type H+-transporting ATPase subunit gamma